MRFVVLLFISFGTTSLFGQYIPRFDVQGHRGARGLKPENTIPAFITALDSGVTTLEMDVVITADRQVVVSHEPYMSASFCFDSTGRPITERQEKKYNIYKMTYDDITKFDCGSRGNEEFPKQQKIKQSKPLLRDVIVAVEDHIRSFTRYEVDYNIEIKSSPDGDGKEHPPVEVFSDLVYELIDQYLPLERIVIQSFDFRVLRYWHTKYPHVRLAALVENQKSIDANLEELGFNPSIYSPHYKLLNREKVAYLKKKKIRVIPWTVNDEKEMLLLRGMGVDGFITDYPDRARKYKMTLNMNVIKR